MGRSFWGRGPADGPAISRDQALDSYVGADHDATDSADKVAPQVPRNFVANGAKAPTANKK